MDKPAAAPCDYDARIAAARHKEPDAPAIRSLLGHHFGYLGYPKHAVRELDQRIDPGV